MKSSSNFVPRLPRKRSAPCRNTNEAERGRPIYQGQTLHCPIRRFGASIVDGQPNFALLNGAMQQQAALHQLFRRLMPGSAESVCPPLG